MQPHLVSIDISSWLSDYKAAHGALLVSDPEFAKWLEEDYRPLAGGWLY